MKNYILNFSVVMLAAIMACDGPIEPIADENMILEAVPATLVFPEDDTECQEGTIISEMQSRVTFLWQESENTDLYEVHLTNLTNDETLVFGSNSSELPIEIQRGTAFSWFVRSISEASETTADSETWHFFNAGLGQLSHAPFPASLLSPNNGQTIDASSGSIELRWDASDVDDDIISYEIYLDTSNPPVTSVGTVDSKELSVDVVSGVSYFWRIKTLDSQNNSSKSDVFNFTVL